MSQRRNTAYSQAIVEAALAAIGRKGAEKGRVLARDVLRIEALVRFSRLHPIKGRYSATIAELESFEKNCAKLLRQLGLPREDPGMIAWGTSRVYAALFAAATETLTDDEENCIYAFKRNMNEGLKALELTVESIRTLLQFAALARDDLRSIEERSVALHSRSDPILQEAVDRLLTLYTKLTGKAPGRSFNSGRDGKPGGPAHRFLSITLPPLGWKRTRTTLWRLIKESNARRKQPQYARRFQPFPDGP